MQPDKPGPEKSASDKLAELLRDCLGGLIVLAMIGWLIYFGITGIVTRELHIGHGIRPSRNWFTKPVHGFPAVLAGFAFLCLAATFISLLTTHPRLKVHVPFWVRNGYWWFFIAFAIMYFTSRIISGS